MPNSRWQDKTLNFLSELRLHPKIKVSSNSWIHRNQNWQDPKRTKKCFIWRINNYKVLSSLWNSWFFSSKVCLDWMLCNSEVLKACAQSAKPMLSRTVALLNHLTLVPMPPPANEQPDVINNGQYYWNLSVFYFCFVISKIKQSSII